MNQHCFEDGFMKLSCKRITSGFHPSTATRFGQGAGEERELFTFFTSLCLQNLASQPGNEQMHN